MADLSWLFLCLGNFIAIHFSGILKLVLCCSVCLFMWLSSHHRSGFVLVSLALYVVSVFKHRFWSRFRALVHTLSVWHDLVFWLACSLPVVCRSSFFLLYGVPSVVSWAGGMCCFQVVRTDLVRIWMFGLRCSSVVIFCCVYIHFRSGYDHYNHDRRLSTAVSLVLIYFFGTVGFFVDVTGYFALFAVFSCILYVDRLTVLHAPNCMTTSGILVKCLGLLWFLGFDVVFISFILVWEWVLFVFFFEPEFLVWCWCVNAYAIWFTSLRSTFVSGVRNSYFLLPALGSHASIVF